MRRSLSFLFAAALALAALPALAEDAPKTKKIANAEYDNWAQFQVGAFVELTNESEVMGQKTTSKTTTKLVELTKEKAVLETTMGEGMPPMRRDVPKELEVPDVPPTDQPKPDVKEGEETIDVAGTSVKCKTAETTTKTDASTATSKVWTSKEIPGSVAKMETKSETKAGDQTMVMTMKMTVTKWSAK